MNNKIYKSQFFSTREETVKWLDEYSVKNYTINDDFSVDVNGDVDLSSKGLIDIPIKFGKIIGSFECGFNNLRSLRGAPNDVDGNFDCIHNILQTLIDSPKNVKGNFGCVGNKFPTLVGAPEYVGKHFYCQYSDLKSLTGAPKTVGGNFFCNNNQLTSLNGSPETVGGSFSCHDNALTNLEYAPFNIALDFVCYKNKLIEFTDFLKRNIGGKTIFTLDKKRFKDKELYNFLNKYFNKSKNTIEIEFNLLKAYLEKIELEKSLNISNNIKSKKLFI